MNQEMNIPEGFIIDQYERDFYFSEDKLSLIWKRLQRRETFTKGQLFPYKVEFSASSQEGEFSPGELNIHHGPLLSVHGVIGEVTSSYRSLHYFYGSYVISFRLIRPVQLDFYRYNNRIHLKLKVYIRPWFKTTWRFLNQVFWSGFRISI